ncbi:Ppx/GppA phosphatase [Cinnamomum micranthum f. kanehirae]|uniref:Ppx/GppA phosphatase n=1 Tax=Cinnamomum micranthum f. kanehirae TaxID=337451 RepID=A0A443PU01_9MAGN|nr:Ppx/GppA phosphatase [Cinnamomum micranthum f. kanehirae]
MSIEIPNNPMNPQKLLAAIDMGSNSFKLFIIRALPNGRFVTVDRLKDPVLLSRSLISTSPSPSPSQTLLPLHSQTRALASLRHFSLIIRHHCISSPPTVVATSALRSASNRQDLLSRIHEELGFHVNVISGEEEARLIYLGVLQFLPVFSKTTLAVDIGGGSTEFVIGKQGQVIFATSLQLGHVSLTESFIKDGEIVNMRNHIRRVIIESGLVEKVKEIGFDIAVGCSGTIRSIERSVFLGFGNERSARVGFGEDFGRGWRFSREELGVIVERLLCGEEVRRVGFSKRRAEFIVAGAVLLLEIFDALGIGEMEVSEYALGEGVIAEMLARDCESFDVNANARWRSVVRVASRFNDEKRMKSNLQCAGIAKEIFEGLRRCEEFIDHHNNSMVSLDDKDLEYLEAAILLHSVGLVMGKKGYHKQSYHIIKNRDHLYGYNDEEVELIALLARYHRKKFPTCEHHPLQSFTKEKFRVLCVIMRICLALHKSQWMTFQGLEISHSHEGFRLVLTELKDQSLLSTSAELMSSNIEAELGLELKHFKQVFQQRLSIIIPSNT